VPRTAARRVFGTGETVRVAGKSHVIDRERAHEQIPDSEKIPIEAEVTGLEGTIIGAPYASPAKDGDYCVPIELATGAVLGVPTDRLERVDRTPRKEASERAGTAGVVMSRASVDFWRTYFRGRGEIPSARGKRKPKKKRNGHG
jgi:hypothetical protein